MADSNTVNYNFILPEIGSSKDTWGTKLNNNFTLLDNVLRTSANSVFLPRTGGGNITGGFIFTAHAAYDARIGQVDFPLTIRRKSDNAIAFRFDGAAGLDASAPDDRSVMNRAMADLRYIRPDQNATFIASTQANLLLGHTSRVFATRRKSDSLDTHNIFDDDITNPDVASSARSILTRAMGDNRFVKLSGGNNISGAQIYSGAATYSGLTSGLISIGGSGATPLYVTRNSDTLVTHIIHDNDITSPDDPSHARSLITRTMGDRRYARQAANSQFSVEQTFNARATFAANSAGTLYAGNPTDSPFYMVRKSDGTITHQIPLADITNPNDPADVRSILTRTMGDRRYGALAAVNTWTAFNRFDDQLVAYGNATGVMTFGAANVAQAVRKSDNAVTHSIPPTDVTDPLVPSLPESLLTRQMGDLRYANNISALEGPVILTKAGSGSVELAHAGVAIQTGGAGQASLAYHMRARNSALSDVFRVLVSGNVQNANNSYGALSDMRLKENIADAGPQLDDLLALQVRHFNLRQGEKHKQVGLIAQEVQQVKPGLVEVGPDGMLSVKYSVLVPLLLKAIQELTEEVRRNSPVTSGA